jgi:hypothetical protein
MEVENLGLVVEALHQALLSSGFDTASQVWLKISRRMLQLLRHRAVE